MPTDSTSPGGRRLSIGLKFGAFVSAMVLLCVCGIGVWIFQRFDRALVNEELELEPIEIAGWLAGVLDEEQVPAGIVVDRELTLGDTTLR